MCSLESRSEAFKKCSAFVTWQTRPSIISVAISTSVPFILLYLDVKKEMLTKSDHKLSFMKLMGGEREREREKGSLTESCGESLM